MVNEILFFCIFLRVSLSGKVNVRTKKQTQTTVIIFIIFLILFLNNLFTYSSTRRFFLQYGGDVRFA